MFESYTVGALFEVRNQAGPALAQIEKSITAIEAAAAAAQKNLTAVAAVRFGALTSSLTGFERRLTSIAAASQEMRATFAENMEAVNAGLMMATRTARELAAALGEVAAGSRVIATTAGVGGGGGSRGGGRGHLSAYAPLGPLHGRMSGGLGLGALAAVGYGAYSEAQLEHSIYRMMITMGQPLTPGMVNTPLGGQIRDMIQQGSISTGLAPADVEQAALTITRQMGGFPMQQRLGIMPDVFKFAGIEAQLKGVSGEEASEALVGILHQFGAYSPADMKKTAASVAYASTVSPLSLEAIQRAAGYAAPTLRAGLGMDPGGLLLLMAQMQSAGITNTKSGTWARNFFTRLMPKGSIVGQVSGRGQKNVESALAQLGMVGPGGQEIGIGLAQKGDYVTLAEILSKNVTRLNKQRPGLGLQEMSTAFGAQGMMFAAMLQDPKFISRMPELRQEASQFLSGGDPGKVLTDLFKADPWFQAQVAIRDFQTALQDLGRDTLPFVTGAIKGLDNIIRTITGQPLSGDGKEQAKNALKTSAVGAAAGFWLGGPVGAAVGAAAPLLPFAKQSIENALSVGIDPITGMPIMTPKGGAGGGGGNTVVNVGGITINSPTDNPKDHADLMIDELTKKLSHANTLNIGAGNGTPSSPFTSGGGP